MLFPYAVDTPMHRPPRANWVLIGLNLVAFGLFRLFDEEGEILAAARPCLLGPGFGDTAFYAYFTNMFLHADLMHLLGNMLILYLFGNPVNAKLGNVFYPVVYLGVGLAADIAFLATNVTPVPALGASGAVNGVVGLYLALYPLKYLRCVYFLWVLIGKVEIPGWVVLGFWFAYDLLMALLGAGGVAYMAHVGGFVAGLGLGLLLLMQGWVVMVYGERSLPHLLRWLPPLEPESRFGVPASATASAAFPVPPPAPSSTPARRPDRDAPAASKPWALGPLELPVEPPTPPTAREIAEKRRRAYPASGSVPDAASGPASAFVDVPNPASRFTRPSPDAPGKADQGPVVLDFDLHPETEIGSCFHRDAADFSAPVQTSGLAAVTRLPTAPGDGPDNEIEVEDDAPSAETAGPLPAPARRWTELEALPAAAVSGGGTCRCGCGKVLRIPAGLAGKAGRCPSCGGRVMPG